MRLPIAEPIYDIIRPLYDPALPKKSRAIEFAAEKLANKEAPWIAIEALYNALNNWVRQYGIEIQATMRHLQNSLKPLARLNNQTELLPAVFGDNTPKVIGYVKKAEGMKALAEARVEKERLDLLDVVALRDDVHGVITIVNDIFSMLYMDLVSDEEAIDRLLPTKDYLWEKNGSLRERLEQASEMLSKPQRHKINEIMVNLPK